MMTMTDSSKKMFVLVRWLLLESALIWKMDSQIDRVKSKEPQIFTTDSSAVWAYYLPVRPTGILGMMKFLVIDEIRYWHQYLTCVLSNRGTWGNLNLEKKNEKEWKNKDVILKFHILLLIVPQTYHLCIKLEFSP